MNDAQFCKIKLKRTLYSAKRIGYSRQPEYFLDYKITTVRYLPTDEHYDIVRHIFAKCDNDNEKVVTWYNEKLLKNVQGRLEAWGKDDISINMIQYERLIKCKNLTRDFLMGRGWEPIPKHHKNVTAENYWSLLMPFPNSGLRLEQTVNHEKRWRDMRTSLLRNSLRVANE